MIRSKRNSSHWGTSRMRCWFVSTVRHSRWHVTWTISISKRIKYNNIPLPQSQCHKVAPKKDNKTCGHFKPLLLGNRGMALFTLQYRTSSPTTSPISIWTSSQNWSKIIIRHNTGCCTREKSTIIVNLHHEGKTTKMISNE